MPGSTCCWLDVVASLWQIWQIQAVQYSSRRASRCWLWKRQSPVLPANRPTPRAPWPVSLPVQGSAGQTTQGRVHWPDCLLTARLARVGRQRAGWRWGRVMASWEGASGSPILHCNVTPPPQPRPPNSAFRGNFLLHLLGNLEPYHQPLSQSRCSAGDKRFPQANHRDADTSPLMSLTHCSGRLRHRDFNLLFSSPRLASLDASHYPSLELRAYLGMQGTPTDRADYGKFGTPRALIS